MIGDKDSAMGFSALGADVFPVEGAEQARDMLARLAKDQYAIVYVTEQFMADMADLVEKYAGQVSPAVVPIPGVRGSLGIGMANVKKSVERAVGADII